MDDGVGAGSALKTLPPCAQHPANQRSLRRRRLRDAGVASPRGSNGRCFWQREVLEKAALHHVRQVPGRHPVLDHPMLPPCLVILPFAQGQKVVTHRRWPALASLDVPMGLVSVPTALQAEPAEVRATIAAFYGATRFVLCKKAAAARCANCNLVGQGMLHGAIQEVVRIGFCQ